MVSSIPIVIVAIGVILVLIALFVWRRRKELTLEGIKYDGYFHSHGDCRDFPDSNFQRQSVAYQAQID
jgi:LPXTG-motif cell wall-anchored protein